MLASFNLLIMDEPTNHLDIESREALEKSLADYDGTMIMVSHDRYFINKLADRIIYLTNDGLESFSGSYDDFCAAHGSTDIINEEKKSPEKGLDYKEQKRLEAQKRKTLNDFKKAEDKISELENKIAKIGEELSKPEIATDFVKAAELSEKSEKLSAELDECFERWEELQTIIEENGYEI